MMRTRLIALSFAPLFFLYSMALILPYTDGDQLHYRLFYERAQDVSLIEVLQLSVAHLNSYEPLSVAVLWLGTELGLNKDIYISFLNTILLASLLMYLLKQESNSIVIFLFLTNYYTIVLMTGAEKLKIAYIFLLIATNVSGKSRFMIAGLSVVAHFQSLILLVSAFAAKFDRSISRLVKFYFLSKRDLFLLVLFVIGLIFFILIFFDGLRSKFNSYSGGGFVPTEFFQIAILGAIGLYLSNKKLKIFLALFSMAPFIVVFGGDRVNMIAFTMVSYLLVAEKRQNNLIFISLLFYMFLKSIFFVENIYVSGNGFSKN